MFLSVQRMLSYSIHYIILYYIIFFYLVQKKKKIYLLKEGMMNAKKMYWNEQITQNNAVWEM